MNSYLPLVIALACILIFKVEVIISQVSCHDKESCNGIFTNTSQLVECYGYRSCLNGVHIETTRTEFYQCSICCHGSYSCFNSSVIQRTSSTQTAADSEIWCGALFSCAFVGTLYNEKGVISCAGEQSCRGSNITLKDESSDGRHVECWGDRSCMDATIRATHSTVLIGHLSGLNAIFYGNSSTTNYWFYASKSGYNATIICGIGHSCEVNCYGNACNKLTLMCSDGSNTNCTFNVDCTYAAKSENNNVCPNGMFKIR